MFGLVVGGVASGVGKTTLTLGLIGALRQRGMRVQPFKVGPDYIDPSQHTQAAGRPSRNLDSWMLPEPALIDLFGRAASSADVAVVEGVMGLFDGRSGAGEIGSTAHVAKLLGLPVLLVIDAAKAARSVAAQVLGCRSFDPQLRIAGVVLNNVASESHAQAVIEPIEREAGLPVLGWLPRDPGLRQDERYLGLVPASERRLPPELLERATARVSAGVDLNRLLSAATFTPCTAGESGLFPAESLAPRVRLAVAQDEAFGFYYQDSLALLAAWGAEVVPFSPLRDDALPTDVDGLYLGGGFPELFASDLSANRSMLDSVRAHAGAGQPLYAECGGLMYLQQGLVDGNGARHAMAGLIPGWSSMERRRLTIGYREVRSRQRTILSDAGTVLRGHEFHWSIGEPPALEHAAYDVLGTAERREGHAADNLLASYVHLHFGMDARLAPDFVNACATARASRGPSTVYVLPKGRSASAEPAPTRQSMPTLMSGDSVVPGPFLRRFGLPPAEIERLSQERIALRLNGSLPIDEPLRGLVTRLVYAAGDLALAPEVVVQNGGIKAAVDALRRCAPVVVDVRMVAAGIGRSNLDRLGSNLSVGLDARGADRIAAEAGITRSAAGILALDDMLDGAVVAIGNAPTALLALLDLVSAGRVQPAAVIGMPVGFVAAAESKEALLDSGLPCIIVRGTRGGSALAAAAVNYLAKLSVETGGNTIGTRADVRAPR